MTEFVSFKPLSCVLPAVMTKNTILFFWWIFFLSFQCMPRIFSEWREKKSTWERWKKSTSCFKDHSSLKCFPASQGWRILTEPWLDKSWGYNRRVSFTCFPDLFSSLCDEIFFPHNILEKSDTFVFLRAFSCEYFHV